MRPPLSDDGTIIMAVVWLGVGGVMLYGLACVAWTYAVIVWTWGLVPLWGWADVDL